METNNASDCYSEIIIKVPWGHISGRWYGNQMERPILALHGWLDNCGTFAKLSPLIAPYRSILCIDLPGHGNSSHLPVGIIYNYVEYVRVILRIMRNYNWKTVSLMGHSMGASVCFQFASFFPDRVDLVISLDTIKSSHWEPHVYIPIIGHSIEKALIDNERLETANISEPPSYTWDECEQLLHKGSFESVDMENCKYILERNVEKSALYPYKYYFSRDGRVKYINGWNPNMGLSLEMAKRICNEFIPYLVIKGGKSQNLSSQATELDEFMVKHNKNFECHIYPMGTHHLHLNNPQPVGKLIINFIQKFEKTNSVFEKSKM